MLINEIFKIFHAYLDSTRPLLLALSGGVDSMCLLHVLMQWVQKTDAKAAIVHVDHGWRQESADEARHVMTLAHDLGWPCYHKKLDPTALSGNLELASRNERYRFFSEVAAQTGAQGILLAHHKDDQIETVFKRLLEGAHLPYLSGMLPATKIDGLALFRPFLEVSKKALLEYAKENSITYFDDPTNRDEAYLRARMRETIFPFLREQFGKEFENNLYAISKEARLLREYFDQRMRPVIAGSMKSDLGYCFDLSEHDFHELEYKECMRAILEYTGIALSRTELQEAVVFLVGQSANKWIIANRGAIYIDRRRIFVFFERNPPKLAYDAPLMLGEQRIGPYTVHVRKCQSPGVHKNHWKDLFAGHCVTYLPQGEYNLQEPHGLLYRVMPQGGKRNFFRCLSDKKIPRYLQQIAPIITRQNTVYEDFMLGLPNQVQEGGVLQITLSRKVHVSR